MLPESVVSSSVVISGPTSIGKTALALQLAALCPDHFEIISADSIQAYRRFDIGSAKPSVAERKRVPFHLVDVVEPNDDFTLVDYQSLALAAARDIVSRGKTPLIVGGTGLYIRSITKGLGVPTAGPDEELRQKYILQAEEHGTTFVHDQLKAIDPLSAGRIHENDLKRIIRALEVFDLTGRPLSSWHEEDAARTDGKPKLYVALDRDREQLYRIIDNRTEEMFASGIIGEVEQLRYDGYSPSLKPMLSVGYLQANLALDGKITQSEAIGLTKTATHQYARRQLIWFRGEPVTHWINIEGKTVETIAEGLLWIINEVH